MQLFNKHKKKACVMGAWDIDVVVVGSMNVLVVSSVVYTRYFRFMFTFYSTWFDDYILYFYHIIFLYFYFCFAFLLLLLLLLAADSKLYFARTFLCTFRVAFGLPACANGKFSVVWLIFVLLWQIV